MFWRVYKAERGLKNFGGALGGGDKERSEGRRRGQRMLGGVGGDRESLEGLGGDRVSS